MCAAHILRSTQHTCRVHMCKMCTHVYKIRAACICFVCVHIVTMQTYAGCMCANCTLSTHFILCTVAIHIIKGLSELYIYFPHKNYILLSVVVSLKNVHKFNLALSNSTNIHFTSSLIYINETVG